MMTAGNCHRGERFGLIYGAREVRDYSGQKISNI